ncbi:hypothetical protein A2995_00015 [Candidatus Nomurabacteria bacterium RIFCSPLOWO2_01_FULL_33_24]|uniref:Uncharacterized protein n=1 Tax=Candidatus Nomurabacteria bacterium RIFCSPLOWO2_01_FULL_33_24 TaxID=1801765 RepID=A0A1F6X307_9BACT|nr:MAG: hypothetical protein A2995_00015 [Candidatus Nomurabacteria bacterium RIFCSPLOWO2_01_FULL_33_24]
MKLRFIVSKTANFFFFIDNLSEWNIYYRKKYNEEWIRQLGELTRQEKIALKNFRLIMQKYEKIGIPKKIRRCFYQKSDDMKASFRKIAKLLSKKEVNILKNSFNIFQPRFERMWNEYLIVLNQNQELMSFTYRKLNKKINLAYSKLENFYGDKSTQKYLCSVFLIISPNRGGKAIEKDVISIETEKLDPKDEYRFTRLWFSIMHELAHARFENKKYKNWLNKFLEKKIILKSELTKKHNAREILREVITDLTKVALYHLLKKEDRIKLETYKYKKDSEKVSDLSSLEKLIRQELNSTIKNYFSTKRKIDTDFLEKCWNLVERYS